jgi:hypothetical protein
LSKKQEKALGADCAKGFCFQERRFGQKSKMPQQAVLSNPATGGNAQNAARNVRHCDPDVSGVAIPQSQARQTALPKARVAP